MALAMDEMFSHNVRLKVFNFVFVCICVRLHLKSFQLDCKKWWQ